MNRTPALLLLLSLQTACSTWVQEVRPLDQAIVPAAAPRRIRVTLQDRTRLELFAPTLSVDSLQGAPWLGAVERRGVPRPLVSKLEVRRSSPAHTLLLVFGIFVGARLTLGPLIEDSFSLGGWSFSGQVR